MNRILALIALVVIVAMAQLVAAGMDACQMCNSVMTGGPRNKYKCPKTAVKQCSINIDGWCCQPTKVHPKCKLCPGEVDDDEDEM
jgi:hypothetical protein